jgi:hypothetical protein
MGKIPKPAFSTGQAIFYVITLIWATFYTRCMNYIYLAGAALVVSLITVPLSCSSEYLGAHLAALIAIEGIMGLAIGFGCSCDSDLCWVSIMSMILYSPLVILQAFALVGEMNHRAAHIEMA